MLLLCHTPPNSLVLYTRHQSEQLPVASLSKRVQTAQPVNAAGVCPCWEVNGSNVLPLVELWSQMINNYIERNTYIYVTNLRGWFFSEEIVWKVTYFGCYANADLCLPSIEQCW